MAEPSNRTWLTDPLIATLTRTLRERGASEDSVQETLIKLMQLPDPPDDPMGWAYTVTWRQAADDAKHERRVQAAHASDAFPRPVEVMDPERELLLKESIRTHRRGWHHRVICTHPARPRYGHLDMCTQCYRRGYEIERLRRRANRTLSDSQ